MLLSAAGCGGLEVKEEPTNDPVVEENEPIKLTLLSQNTYESYANVVRDLLTKQGFEVELSIQADSSSYNDMLKNGNYDIAICRWGNSIHASDYAVRPLFYTGGNSNRWQLSDATLDDLIDAARSVSKEKYVEAYGAIEDYLVGEMTYCTPLNQEVTINAYSKVMNETVELADISYWAQKSYADASLNETRPLNLAAAGFDLSTFDPIRGDNRTIGTPSSNIYIKLLRLDAANNYDYTTENSLSWNFAVSEDNQSFYFILRDDCFFTRVSSEGTAVVTDHRVAGEDVVFSVNRMRDPNSVPTQAVSNNYQAIDDVYIVSDMEELKSAVTSTGESVYDALNLSNLPSELTTLVGTRDEVNNDEGKYQVVCLHTEYPFVQILNNLTQHCGGIVDADWVTQVNSQVDFANYDPNTDVLYGDTNKMILSGGDFNNTLSCSGHYVMLHWDDYGIYLEKNDGCCTRDGGAPIRYLNYLNLTNSTAAFTALRSGDLDMAAVPSDMISVAESDETLNTWNQNSASMIYLTYNYNDTSRPCSDILVRKAIAASIDQDAIIAAIGAGVRAYSVITPAVDCGRVFEYDPSACASYLQQYYDSKK